MKIILEREKCIGCGSCQAICPDVFELKEDVKSHLKGGKGNPDEKSEELEIPEVSCVKEAAEICPVQCIKILN